MTATNQARDDLHIDLAEARRVLASVTARTVTMYSGIADGSAPVKGLLWTVGEVGAHVAIVPLGFAFAAMGDFSAVEPYLKHTDSFGERLAGATAGTLEIEPERDPAKLAAALRERIDGYLESTAGMGEDGRVATPWYGPDMSLPVANATAMLVAEQLIHGWDVARTVGKPWTISEAEATLAVRALTTMLPLVADPVATKGLRASYGVAMRRGGPRFSVFFDKGQTTVEGGLPRPVDCHISAEPLPFVLVAYGRLNQWGPIARMQLAAWGRKPWLAFRFASLFIDP